MSQLTDHRRAIANALQSIGALPEAKDIILDNFDLAVAFAWEAGKDDCASRVIELVQSHIQMQAVEQG